MSKAGQKSGAKTAKYRAAPPLLWLARSRSDVCCHCTCKQGLVGIPGQMDCPWCGCGWLLSCIKCRKAFTFAKPVRVEQSAEELAEADFRAMFKRKPSKKEVAEWAGSLLEFFGDLEEGLEYCYLDGALIPTNETEIKFEGLFAKHSLKKLPQVLALTKPGILETTLASPEYWTSRERPNRDD